MKRIFMFLFILVLWVSGTGQTTIVRWDFEDQTTHPAEGEGIIELIGGVEEASSVFPQGSGGSGTYAYNTSGYPAQGTASGTAGFQFNLSTLSHENIRVAFAVRGSNTASKWAEFQFSVDGGSDWQMLQNNEGLFNNGWQGTYEIEFPKEVNNIADFKFRIVTIFEPGTEEYQPIGSGNYSTSGTLRIDDVHFYSVETASMDSFVNEKVRFYPNPAKDIIYFDLPEILELEVKIFDVLGAEIMTRKNLSNPLDISTLKSGIYIMKLAVGNAFTTCKLVVR